MTTPTPYADILEGFEDGPSVHNYSPARAKKNADKPESFKERLAYRDSDELEGRIPRPLP